MNSRLVRQILAVAIAFSAMGAGSAWAWAGPPRSVPRDGGLPASVRRVQRETGGEVLKAQPIERDGHEVYRVKVLTPQGRIRVVEDEPQRQDLPPTYPRQPQPMQYPRQASPPYFPPPGNHHPE